MPENDAPMPDESRGLSRRQMIAAAGMAGAAAWTAPVIIDSLSSPAAAITGPAGTFRFQLVVSGNASCDNTYVTPTSTTCLPTGWAGATDGNLTNPAATYGLVVTACDKNSATINFTPHENCTITNARSTRADASCDANVAAPGFTYTFPAASSNKYAIYRFTITCT